MGARWATVGVVAPSGRLTPKPAGLAGGRGAVTVDGGAGLVGTAWNPGKAPSANPARPALATSFGPELVAEARAPASGIGGPAISPRLKA
jgi:hypothetical protein